MNPTQPKPTTTTATRVAALNLRAAMRLLGDATATAGNLAGQLAESGAFIAQLTTELANAHLEIRHWQLMAAERGAALDEMQEQLDELPAD